MKLFSGQAVDGNSLEVVVPSGEFVVMLSGNLGGGTVAVEVKLPDSSGFVALSGASHTATGAYRHEIGAPAVVRLSVTGSTTPSLDAWLESDEPYTRVSVRGRVA